MRPPIEAEHHASTPMCAAPFSSLHLDPRGVVRACCMNHYQPLGRIGERSLRDIWAGSQAERLRGRVAAGSLALGCEMCKTQVDGGAQDAAYFHTFDHLQPVERHPRWPRQLELALTNACNFQCVMCNGDLSSAIRLRREGRPPLPPVYDDAFFEDLDAFLPHLESVVLLGGEPFLGAEPLRVLERLVERGLTPRCHIATNGSQWSPRIQRIVTSLPIHVSVSIDAATAATTAAIRVGADHDAVIRNTVAFRDCARSVGADCSISFSLQRRNVHEFGAVLALADELDLPVTVNLVSYPPAHSLLHLDDHSLGAVLSELEDEDEDAERNTSLRLNRTTWSATLDQLASLRDGRIPTPATPVDTPTLARSLAAAAADERGVGVVQCDSNQIIDAVETGPIPSAESDGLVGASIGTMPEVLGRAFGRTESTDVHHRADGVEERTLVFSRDDTTTTIHAFATTTENGSQVWCFAARSEFGTSPAHARPG